MSRAVTYGSLIAACAAALVMSCARNAMSSRRHPQSPISVDFSCVGGSSKIGLSAEGRAGWLVETKDKKIEWDVPNNVTIDAITAKSGDLPVEPESGSEGKTKGKPYKAKVKNGVQPSDTRYPYAIALTCDPGGGQQPVKLTIDPEMIVR